LQNRFRKEISEARDVQNNVEVKMGKTIMAQFHVCISYISTVNLLVAIVAEIGPANSLHASSDTASQKRVWLLVSAENNSFWN